MKQALQLKIGQQLAMTPQLQQAIRLLQLSTLDLQQEIQEALDNNPMLEAADEELDGHSESVDHNSKEATPESSDELTSDDQWNKDIPENLPVDSSWDEVYESSYSGLSQSSALSTDDEPDFDNRRTTVETLQDHLQWQLNLTPMEERDRVIATTLIDAVEPSGMLGSPVEELYTSLRQQLDELEPEEVLAVLHRIQQFDPVGVAAENLQDCLLIQLRQLPPTTPWLKAATLIVQNHLELLGTHDYRTLIRRSRLKEDELKQAIALIQSLNPRPGDGIQYSPVEYVIPDVFVRRQHDRWMVELNPDIAPKLRINSGYAALVKRADSSSDNVFLRNNLQEARWFLKSLQSRNETLLRVATSIVEKQIDFFEQGEEAMRPLILQDIAEQLDMHESTISRVTTQKFMHTPMGTFELKYFFSSHVSTADGGECSSTAIRARIKKLVSLEQTQKPLSDSKIAKLLEDEGIQVARRTVAKYRESLNIPPSNERKQLL